jgi:hypothetical protein
VLDELLSTSNPFLWTTAHFVKDGHNTALWWQLLNKHKRWSPASHHYFPPGEALHSLPTALWLTMFSLPEFKAAVITFLLCMKQLAPALRYPLPKQIQVRPDSLSECF